jgi:putative addiction module component (TIGR02574 family)
MAASMKSLGIDQWSSVDRLRLMDEIWDSLDQEEATQLTTAQTEDLKLRLEEHRRNPDDVIPWEEAKKQLRWD